MSKVDLLGLAASSKPQATNKHERNGKKPHFCHRESHLAEFLVANSYGCEVPSHKI